MKIKLIDYGFSKAPKRAHYNDAGADIYSNNDYTLHTNETIKIPLGFGLELPDGYVAFVAPRSSLASQGIMCQLAPIDSGYTGEIHAIVTNCGNDFCIKKDTRIGQILILPCVICDYSVELGEKRNDGNFGSTGK